MFSRLIHVRTVYSKIKIRIIILVRKLIHVRITFKIIIKMVIQEIIISILVLIMFNLKTIQTRIKIISVIASRQIRSHHVRVLNNLNRKWTLLRVMSQEHRSSSLVMNLNSTSRKNQMTFSVHHLQILLHQVLLHHVGIIITTIVVAIKDDNNIY